MTITFENDNDVIVYAFEKMINYASKNRYIFVAQSVWWLASVIGLESWLVTHIDNLRVQLLVPVTRLSGLSLSNQLLSEGDNIIHPERKTQISNTQGELQDDNDIQFEQRCDKVLNEAKSVLNISKKQRNEVTIDPMRRTRTRKKLLAKLSNKQKKRLNRRWQESPKQIRSMFRK